MTWNAFINAIYSSKITNDKPRKILERLFIAAGRKQEFSEAAAYTWLRGERNCDSSKYFPNEEVNHEEVFKFFRNRSEEKLQNLQKIFQKAADSDSPIDVKTDDLDVFCWSLVNQFLDLHGFQRVDIPHIDTPSEATDAETTHLLSKQGTDISGDTIPEQAQEPLHSLPPGDSANISAERKRSIRSMILPHSENCCYHCVYWEGNRQTFGAHTTATYGFCSKYNKQQLSSDSPCKDYKKRQKLFGDW